MYFVVLCGIVMSCQKDLLNEPVNELKSANLKNLQFRYIPQLYFESAKPWPTDYLTVGGYVYSQEQAKEIYDVKNESTAKHAFVAVVTIKLQLHEILLKNPSFPFNNKIVFYVSEIEKWLNHVMVLSPTNLPDQNLDEIPTWGFIPVEIALEQIQILLKEEK